MERMTEKQNWSDKFVLGDLFLIALAIIIFTSCGARKEYIHVPVKTLDVTIVRDTVIEYRPIPVYIEKKIFIERDTSSIIETDLIKSVAEFKDGFLFHAVAVFPKTIPIQIQYKERIVEVDKPIIHEVKVNRLTAWQHRQIVAFWILLVLILAYIVYKIKR